MMELLFVCTGNTCRSPMAEYIARDEVKKRGLEITVSSAGMMGDGMPASGSAQVVCDEIGLDLSGHLSRLVTPEIADRADIIFTMTDGHRRELVRLGVPEEKIRVLNIPDPYGMPLEIYRVCRDSIRSAVGAFLDTLCSDVSEIKIVPLEKEHAKKLAELEKICFSDPWSEDGIAYEADNGSARFLVAMCGGEIAGYAGMMYAADFAGICNVAVFPEYRRRGIAKKLMEALIDICESLEVSVLSLEVRESNTGAISLYKQLGFESVGRRKGFYSSPNEDAIVMNKQL